MIWYTQSKKKKKQRIHFLAFQSFHKQKNLALMIIASRDSLFLPSVCVRTWGLWWKASPWNLGGSPKAPRTSNCDSSACPGRTAASPANPPHSPTWRVRNLNVGAHLRFKQERLVVVVMTSERPLTEGDEELPVAATLVRRQSEDAGHVVPVWRFFLLETRITSLTFRRSGTLIVMKMSVSTVCSTKMTLNVKAVQHKEKWVKRRSAKKKKTSLFFKNNSVVFNFVNHLLHDISAKLTKCIAHQIILNEYKFFFFFCWLWLHRFSDVLVFFAVVSFHF